MANVRRIIFLPDHTYEDVRPGDALECPEGTYVYVLYPSGVWNWFQIKANKTIKGLDRKTVPTWALMLLMLAL